MTGTPPPSESLADTAPVFREEQFASRGGV